MGRVHVTQHISDFGLLQWRLGDTRVMATADDVLAHLRELGASPADLRFGSTSERSAFATTFPTVPI